MSDSELRKFFEFGESDLKANRAGQLSSKQKTKFDEAEKGANQIFVGAGIFLVLLGLVIAYAVAGDLVVKLLTGGSLNSDEITGIALGVGMPFLLCGFFAYWAFRLARDKIDLTVMNVEGKVNFVKVEKQIHDSSSNSYRRVEQYELRVGKIAFENVNEELLNITDEGDTYAFYYTRQMKKILSCEFISKGK